MKLFSYLSQRAENRDQRSEIRDQRAAAFACGYVVPGGTEGTTQTSYPLLLFSARWSARSFRYSVFSILVSRIRGWPLPRDTPR